jgi:hypothetical protein
MTPGNGKEEQTEARTEEQELVEAPLRVRLGGRRWEIKPLKINPQYAWREQFFEAFVGIAKNLRPPRAPLLSWLPVVGKRLTQYNETKSFVELLNVGLIKAPKVVADLFFAYAKDLPRKQIEETATERELVYAFKEVMRYAFPFYELVGWAMDIAKKANPQQWVKPTSTPSATGASRPST